MSCFFTHDWSRWSDGDDWVLVNTETKGKLGFCQMKTCSRCNAKKLRRVTFFDAEYM